MMKQLDKLMKKLKSKKIVINDFFDDKNINKILDEFNLKSS
mgnify:CR=1 FL=1